MFRQNLIFVLPTDKNLSLKTPSVCDSWCILVALDQIYKYIWLDQFFFPANAGKFG